MKKLTKILALALALVMLLSMAACGSKEEPAAPADPAAPAAPAEPAGDGSYTIGVTTWGSGVPILDMFGNENEYVLGLIGVGTNRVSDDFTADKQVTNIQNLISAGVNGVVNQGSGVTTIPQMAALCKDAGIPIVFNVSCGLEEDLVELQNSNEYYVGAVDADMVLDGKIIAEKAYADGSMKTAAEKYGVQAALIEQK